MIWLTPERENDGTRYAWRLHVSFDNDWQDWKIDNDQGAGGVEFSVHIPDEWVEGMNIPIKDEADADS